MFHRDVARHCASSSPPHVSWSLKKTVVPTSVNTCCRFTRNADAVTESLSPNGSSFTPASYWIADSGGSIPFCVASELKFARWLVATPANGDTPGAIRYSVPTLQLTGASVRVSVAPGSSGCPPSRVRPGTNALGVSDVDHQSCRRPTRSFHRAVRSIWSVTYALTYVALRLSSSQLWCSSHAKSRLSADISWICGSKMSAMGGTSAVDRFVRTCS